MKHVVVGTAGHVDHGKTSLIEALTGTNCDRLPEEKARGITIELGFAEWALPGGIRASVVDVPGHERFVRTMVAGAAGIDLVVLCVAADDGVMPQTREHLAICSLLGVSAGVVAITKADLADAETLSLVEEDVREATAGSFLEGAPVVRCSSRDRRGLDDLAREVARVADSRPGRPSSGPAFVGIDRAFSKPGAGAIVTGTLARGAIAVGDELDVLPTARGEVARAKVRALHVHGKSVERVSAPTRVAVNLRGDVEGALVRGAALASAGWQKPARVLLAAIELLPSAKTLKRRASLALHVGTSQHAAHATLVGADELAPGGKALARIAVHAPIAAFAGQRLVLRRPELGRDRTIGGGVVLDPHPRVTRGKLAGAHGHARALIEEARYVGIDAEELARRLAPGTDVGREVAALRTAGVALEVEQRLYAAALLEEARDAVLRIARAPTGERPLTGGVAAAEIETRAPARVRKLVPLAIAALVASKALAQDGALVREPSRAPGPSGVVEKLAAVYARAALTPPLEEEARAQAGMEPRVFRDALAELKRRGTLRTLSAGLHFDAGAIDALKSRVAEYFARAQRMTPVDFKALCGVSRKFAIPLLEWLDAEGATRRQGDARVAGPAARRA